MVKNNPDITWFQISMNNLGIMNMLDNFEQLNDYYISFCFSKELFNIDEFLEITTTKRLKLIIPISEAITQETWVFCNSNRT